MLPGCNSLWSASHVSPAPHSCGRRATWQPHNAVATMPHPRRLWLTYHTARGARARAHARD